MDEVMAQPDACQWRAACTAEFNGMLEKGVFEVVERQKETPVLTSCWVFTYMLVHDGNMIKYKTRLVIKGIAQIPGRGFNLTWSAMSSWETLWIFLAYAAEHDLELCHCDITQAPNSATKSANFVEQPEGFGDRSEPVQLLKKYLYGLKQAPRVCNPTMTEHLGTLGMWRGESDARLHNSEEKDPEGVKTFLVLWGDDFFRVGRLARVSRVMRGILRRFQVLTWVMLSCLWVR
jgi:hypothetical protein